MKNDKPETETPQFIGNATPGTKIGSRVVIANTKTRREARAIAGSRAVAGKTPTVEGYLCGKFKRGWVVTLPVETANAPTEPQPAKPQRQQEAAPPKKTKPKKLAPPRIKELYHKLKALAERGVNGEKEVAREKLARLLARYDVDTPNDGGADIFAGVFIPATEAAPIISFEVADFDIANAVKWGIEGETGIRCLYRQGQLCAQAEPTTAAKLHDIAAQVSASFAQLWREFEKTPTITRLDRPNFILGLFEGMMDEERSGEALPPRAHGPKPKGRQKKKAEAPTTTLAVHPYSIAAKMGRQIRFSVPIMDITGELNHAIKAALPEPTTP